MFQSFGLIPILTAAENVGVPLRLRRVEARAREERVEPLPSLVGLADRAGQGPGELSGGRQQRVAIARTLANSPALGFARPGGPPSALVATHGTTLPDLADRVLELGDAEIVEP